LIPKLETKHVRRRIDETQTPIKIERIATEVGFESLRQNDLEDVARPNVFLGSFDCALEFFRMKIALAGSERCVPTNRLRFGIRRRNKRKISRFRKVAHDRMDRVNRSRMDSFEWTVIEECVCDDLQGAQPMVKDKKAVCDHEDRLWQLQFIMLRCRNL